MRRYGWLILLVITACLSACTAPRAEETAAPTRVEDVIYGRKHGVALTLDVFKPAKATGVGVLWMVSGGWFSSHDSINPDLLKGFLDRGQTVFAVVHGSQPKYAIPEILQDVHRATRFVRYHAKEYGVDPDRLGIAGGSAGGHLSLMQGAGGKDGDPQAKDPVERVSSRVQAVACFFPPTDFLNYGKSGENALLGVLKSFRPAFGPASQDAGELVGVLKPISPYSLLTRDMPPTLIIHGDADVLVPIQQSQLVMTKLEELGVPHKLVVREGKGHGWPTLGEDIPILAEWIDQYAKPK